MADGLADPDPGRRLVWPGVLVALMTVVLPGVVTAESIGCIAEPIPSSASSRTSERRRRRRLIHAEVTPARDENRFEAERYLTEALVAYERAIALAPDQAIARIGYAWVLEQANRLEEAAPQYRAAIALARLLAHSHPLRVDATPT